MKKVTWLEANITSLGLCVGNVLWNFFFKNDWNDILLWCVICVVVVNLCWYIWFKAYQKI